MTDQLADVATDEELTLGGPWSLIVWDDPVNLQTYVEHVFMTYFGLSRQIAHERMMQVHTEGRSVLAVGTREEIERHVTAMHAYGLQATLEKAA